MVDPYTIRLNFSTPMPDKQITDLLQFISPIDPAGIADVEAKPAGTGPYVLAERVLGQRVRMTANPRYWRAEKPILNEVISRCSATTTPCSRARVRLDRHGLRRRLAPGLRLRSAGFQLIQGPARWCRCSASTPPPARSATRSSARPSTS